MIMLLLHMSHPLLMLFNHILYSDPSLSLLSLLYLPSMFNLPSLLYSYYLRLLFHSLLLLMIVSLYYFTHPSDFMHSYMLLCDHLLVRPLYMFHLHLMHFHHRSYFDYLPLLLLLLHLLLMYSLLMLMYSFHTFTVIHLHLNNLPLLTVFIYSLLNYYLLIVSSSLQLLMSLHLPLLNAHFHHMSMLLFTMLPVSILLLFLTSLIHNLPYYDYYLMIIVHILLLYLHLSHLAS